MGAMDKLQRRTTTEEQQRQHAEAGKQLEKLDIIADAYKKAGIDIPELERIRRSLRAAHEAIGLIFKDESAK